jgi:hypothetical protein
MVRSRLASAFRPDCHALGEDAGYGAVPLSAT